jgi:hypothetical protein
MTQEFKSAVADNDPPDVETEMDGPFALARVDARDMLAEFEASAELHPKLVRASIRMTKPQDWLEMGGKVYLQGTGVERMATPWGLIFGEPTVTREDYPDGEFAYIVTGPVGSRKTGVYYRAIPGGRSSRDPFFDSYDEEKPQGFKDLTPGEREQWKRAHRVMPDPMEVRKAAYTNWQTRGASMVTGMRGLTAKDLEEQGLTGVKSVAFTSGGKGGDTTPGDLKAEGTKLWNEILRRTGGDVPDAKKVLKDITSYAAYTNQAGRAVSAFAGIDSPDQFRDTQKVRIALSKLKDHPAFGDKAAAEPGSGG